MKKLILALFLLSTLSSNAQEFSKKELKRLSRLEINLPQKDSITNQINSDFNEILFLERKRKSNKTSGIILSSLSALSIATGVGIIANPVESTGHENAYRNLIGGVLIASGAIEGGIGIPLLFVSKRKKRQRDLLIEKYKNSN